jgi:hypothetical protein
MRSNKKGPTQGTKAKRGFAVLDRDETVKAAAAAVGLLRSLVTFATSSAAWRCGLGYALELVETQLNDILLFSSASRLPEHLFCDAEDEKVPSDVGKARKDAAGAVKMLRNILKDARADLSVDAYQSNRLDNALDLVEQELNNLLPPPGAPTGAKLPFDEEEDEVVRADLDDGGETKS